MPRLDSWGHDVMQAKTKIVKGKDGEPRTVPALDLYLSEVRKDLAAPGLIFLREVVKVPYLTGATVWQLVDGTIVIIPEKTDDVGGLAVTPGGSPITHTEAKRTMK